MTRKRLTTVPAMGADPSNPFSESSIRWFVFNAATNGMDDHAVIVRIGKRVYIDVDAFDRWIDSQQERRAAA